MNEHLTKRQIQHRTTLEAIRTAVDKLVLEKGFADMRIQDICNEVGISIGAFYHYFSSKSDLLMDRYRRTNEHLRCLHAETLVYMEPIEALKLLQKEMVLYTRSRLYNILLVYFQTQLEDYQKWMQSEGAALYEITLGLVQRGQATGAISKRKSASNIVSFLMIWNNGSVATHCMNQELYHLDADVFLQGIYDWLDSLA